MPAADNAALQQQLAAMTPTFLVQAGQLAPAPRTAQPTGWDTAESLRGRVTLLATYDSSGPDAWDVKSASARVLHPVDRSATAERLTTGTRHSPVAFSPDGRFLAFDEKNANTSDDARVVAVQDGSARPIADTRFGEGSAKFSPDGRWITYSSDESGRPQVYVQSFPGPGPKVQVSSEGGIDPVWSRAGGELFYRSFNRMMAVSVITSPAFRASAPKLLWEGNYSRGLGSSCGMPGVTSSNYDVTADGQRFLMVRDDDNVTATKVVVVLNWAEELKRAAERAAVTN